MPKFIVWVSTSQEGSECQDEFEVEDEQLDGLTEEEQEDYITDITRDVINNLHEWGYRKVDEND